MSRGMLVETLARYAAELSTTHARYEGLHALVAVLLVQDHHVTPERAALIASDCDGASLTETEQEMYEAARNDAQILIRKYK